MTDFAPKYLLERQNIAIIPSQLKQVSTNNLETDRKTALANTIRSHNYNKSIFDKNRVGHEFKVRSSQEWTSFKQKEIRRIKKRTIQDFGKNIKLNFQNRYKV